MLCVVAWHAQAVPQAAKVVRWARSLRAEGCADPVWCRAPRRFPRLFCSRLGNKVWYSQVGGLEIVRNTCRTMWQNTRLVCDGVHVPLPPGTQGIIVLNIGSYGGGADLWGPVDGSTAADAARVTRMSRSPHDAGPPVLGSSPSYAGATAGAGTSAAGVARVPLTDDFVAPSPHDGMLEIVAVTGSLHLAQTQGGRSVGNPRSIVELLTHPGCCCLPQSGLPTHDGWSSAEGSRSPPPRRCRCRCVRRVPLYAQHATPHPGTAVNTVVTETQIDGEPVLQPPSTISVGLLNQAVVLRRSVQRSGLVASRLVEVLDWGQATGVITAEQRTVLLRELAERSQGIAT